MNVIGDHFVDVPSLSCGFSDGSHASAILNKNETRVREPSTNATSLRLSVATNGADFGRRRFHKRLARALVAENRAGRRCR